ncbi:hypothetical protein [Haloglomus litoreum]|uniref:hypothetical protein n=1 Tax=Haloglomus litoreum TaxID=3034026 RepID=UPI0023E8FC1C|nr:hypothetical protein [Haloglomus sp. DT116]
MRDGGLGSVATFVRTPRAWLGSLAVTDLLRLLPDGAAPEWVLASVSIGAGLVPGVATPVTVCLFAGAIYTFVPRFYPERMGLPDEARGFRLLATAVALSVALLVAAAEGVTDLGWGLGVGGLVFLGGIAGMLGYLAWVHDWRLLDAERPPVQPVAGLAREEYGAVEAEISDDLRRDGVVGALGAFFWLLALGLVVVIPAAIAGFVTNVLYNAYPLPELLVLGWVALGVVGRFFPDVHTPTLASLDLEDRLYGTVKHATRTLKGMMLTLFAVCGLFGGAGYVLIGVRLLAAAPTPAQFLTAPALAVALLAFITAPLVAGGYLIWCWLRQFRRVQPFLDRWIGDDAPDTAPARPVGQTAPPTLLVLVVATLLGGLGDHPLVVPAAAVIVPVGMLGLVAIVLRTRQLPETPLGREGGAVTAGLVVQSIGLVLAGSAEQLWPALVEGRLPPALLDPQLLVILALVPAVGVWPDVDRYHDGTEGWRRYLRSAFACGFGLCFGSVGVLLGGGLGLALTAIGTVAFLGGVALTVTTYYGV